MTVADFKKAYTNTYWVTFLDGLPSGCITVLKDEDPLAVAGAFGTIKTIDSLPYPANPVLRRRALRDDKDIHCPEFCYSPNQCKGRTSCPKNYACSE
jgi:hypothetical protein